MHARTIIASTSLSVSASLLLQNRLGASQISLYIATSSLFALRGVGAEYALNLRLNSSNVVLVSGGAAGCGAGVCGSGYTFDR